MNALIKPYVESIRIWKKVRNRDRTPASWKDTTRRIEGCKAMIEFYRKREREATK